MSDHKHCKEFTRSRVQSAIRVNNALNGSMHKFRARDGRDVSFHVYYQSQQERLVKALGLAKPSSEYGLLHYEEGPQGDRGQGRDDGRHGARGPELRLRRLRLHDPQP